jgi:hypothetical protein
MANVIPRAPGQVAYELADIIFDQDNNVVGVTNPKGEVVQVGSSGGGTTSETVSRTLSSSDNNKTLVVNSASATTFTILNDSTGGWGDDAFVTLFQSGVGAPAFAAGSGVTIRNPSVLVASQYKHLSAHRVGANEWAIL